MAGRDADETSDTMRERADESTWKLRLLLHADRRVVTLLFSGSLFVAILAVGVAHPTPARELLVRGDPVETLYQALVTSTVTGVTLVLTLSQLVLSQELGAVGDQRERMTGAMEFRADVADAVGTPVSPAEPSAFLRSLVRATRERAEALGDAVDGDDGASAELRDLVGTYVDAVVDNADGVTDQLEGATFGEFDVVDAALNYNYSWKVYAGRRLREEYGDDLPPEASDALGALLDALELFGPAREHFKTLYFQWELSNLSRTLLYAAVPALAVAVVSLAFFDPRDVAGATLGVDHALVVLAATTTVSLVPFTILLAYVLRIVTITKRTLSIGPFILRRTDRSVDVDWE
ncbi:MAG: hypothetical protein ABEJ61_03805 [Haloferacaceae archaeon]